MSKMIKVESCSTCDIRLRGFCALYLRHVLENRRVTDQSKILPNCPLEDYQEKEPDSLAKCGNCKKPRGNDEHGAFIYPCPHCGDEIPF